MIAADLVVAALARLSFASLAKHGPVRKRRRERERSHREPGGRTREWQARVTASCARRVSAYGGGRVIGALAVHGAVVARAA